MYKISEQTRIVGNEDGAVILDLERGKVLHLNRTGAFIWNSLLRNQLPEQIIAEISSEFQILESNVALDVNHFLSCLQQEGLLVTIQSGKESDCAN